MQFSECAVHDVRRGWEIVCKVFQYRCRIHDREKRSCLHDTQTMNLFIGVREKVRREREQGQIEREREKGEKKKGIR